MAGSLALTVGLTKRRMHVINAPADVAALKSAAAGEQKPKKKEQNTAPTTSSYSVAGILPPHSMKPGRMVRRAKYGIGKLVKIDSSGRLIVKFGDTERSFMADAVERGFLTIV